MDVAVDRSEKAMELLERAAKLGLRLEFQDGLNILKKTASADEEEAVDNCLREIMKYLPEVRAVLERRAVVALAKKHIGSRIFSSEYGSGKLISASDNGLLTIRINLGIGNRSQSSVTADAESIFLISDEPDAECAPSAADQKTESELPRKKLFGLI